MDDPIDKIERERECEFLRPKLFSKIYSKLGTWKLYLREVFSKFYDKTLVENFVAKTLAENLVTKTLVENLFAKTLVLEPWIAAPLPSESLMIALRISRESKNKGWVAFAKIRSIFF